MAQFLPYQITRLNNATFDIHSEAMTRKEQNYFPIWYVSTQPIEFYQSLSVKYTFFELYII